MVFASPAGVPEPPCPPKYLKSASGWTSLARRRLAVLEVRVISVRLGRIAEAAHEAVC